MSANLTPGSALSALANAEAQLAATIKSTAASIDTVGSTLDEAMAELARSIGAAKARLGGVAAKMAVMLDGLTSDVVDLVENITEGLNTDQWLARYGDQHRSPEQPTPPAIPAPVVEPAQADADDVVDLTPEGLERDIAATHEQEQVAPPTIDVDREPVPEILRRLVSPHASDRVELVSAAEQAEAQTCANPAAAVKEERPPSAPRVGKAKRRKAS
jgi:hypothetical protein